MMTIKWLLSLVLIVAEQQRAINVAVVATWTFC